MKTTRLMQAGLLAIPLVLAAGSAMAQRNTVSIGLANVQPHSSTSDFSGPFTPSGISLDVRDKTMPFFSYSRELNEQWEVEFAMGLPPTHDISLVVNNPALPGGAQALNGQIGARVRQVAPTLFFNYKFLEKTSAFRPFLGVGVNYTSFDHTSSNAAGNALNGGPTSISLEDSVGLALQAGVTYPISNQWSLTAALVTARVKSKITTNTLGIQRNADITFHPRVFVLSADYSF